LIDCVTACNVRTLIRFADSRVCGFASVGAAKIAAGGMVGAIVISMYLPRFKLLTLIK